MRPKVGDKILYYSAEWIVDCITDTFTILVSPSKNIGRCKIPTPDLLDYLKKQEERRSKSRKD